MDYKTIKKRQLSEEYRELLKRLKHCSGEMAKNCTDETVSNYMKVSDRMSEIDMIQMYLDKGW